MYIPVPPHEEELEDMTPLDALNVIITAATKWQSELHDYIIPGAGPDEDTSHYEDESEDIEHAVQMLSPATESMLLYIPAKPKEVQQ